MTQAVHPGDPVLGVVIDMIRALGRVSDLTVIANEVRLPPGDLPGRLISLGKESGASQTLRGLRYLRAVEEFASQGGRGHRGGLLVHMCPVYLHLAVPVARARGIRTLLWYAQAGADRSLRLAERLADTVVTTVPGSYPGRRRSVVAIGQAIDTRMFPYSPVERDGPLAMLAIGRTSASKRYDVAIRAVAQARASGLDAMLRIIGPSTTAAEQQVRSSLLALIDELGLGDAVQLEPGIPRSEIPEAIRRCHALVNTTADGSADKAVFEAMAVGRPVLTSNPALAALTGGWPLRVSFDTGSAPDLAAVIRRVDAAETGLLTGIGRGLRERILQEHSVEHWASRVAALAAGRP